MIGFVCVCVFFCLLRKSSGDERTNSKFSPLMSGLI